MERQQGTARKTSDNSQLTYLLHALRAVQEGDFSVRLECDNDGVMGEIAEAFNEVVSLNEQITGELVRINTVVGLEGNMDERASMGNVSGGWKTGIDSINSLVVNLAQPTAETARVLTDVARGDLSRKIALEIDGRKLQGEFLRIGDVVNTMVDQLSGFASEVTRVAREVGTEGILGGQAQVTGVSGVWKDLTDNVNAMAGSLTSQVRNIAEITTAVAQGDLSKKITVEASGEILELKDTINKMVDQLNSFASEVTRVAREVGTEGKLGGQAQVRGVSGVWKDLTDNVNQLAGNLTIQVRAIADVATAVIRGDLSRSISVEALGEVADLKDNLNRMIITLRETTRRNEEQDWLKTNLARFTRMLQGERDLQTVSQLVMSELTPLVNGNQGVFYMMDGGPGYDSLLKLLSSYAYVERKNVSNRWRLGEGLVGQCALEKKPILLTNVPDDYIKVTSGLGEAKPRNIIVLPVLFEGQVLAVIEIASFNRFSETHRMFLDQLMESLGVVLNMIQASMRTEELLKQSQQLAEELQTRQEDLKRSNEELEEQTRALKQSQELLKSQREELRKTNDELEDKARKLEGQKRMVELKNSELQLAQASLEERAEQLAITSRYKSEFLANMSHELRTPLNSLLLLAGLLAENREGNLTPKQVEYVGTVHSSGQDLLALINEILDLSKIEAGRMELDLSAFPPDILRDFAERTFRQLADQKGIDFTTKIHENLPDTMRTDRMRLEQILRNLLSNAFKFTESGSVLLEIGRAAPGIHFRTGTLRHADTVIAFAVKDTGIGIRKDREKIIWEAFQQVDGTTSRKYGGTGLGLTISREIAQLLGGEIHLLSREGEGSVFTLYLPLQYVPAILSGSSAESSVKQSSNGPNSTDERSLSFQASHTSDFLSYGFASDAPADYDQTDDRYNIRPNDRVVLIIEDDLEFANALKDMAGERDFKVLVSQRGDTGLALAHEFKPDAIILDLLLPIMDGWTILKRLKSHPKLRHIPVHIISAVPERNKEVNVGALSYLTKPVDKETLDRLFGRIEGSLERRLRRLLVAEDDELERNEIVRAIGNGEVEVTAVGTGAEVLDALQGCTYDCLILDLMLPDMKGIDVLQKVYADLKCNDLPVIIYTTHELSEEERSQLAQYAGKIILKGSDSAARLVDETALFLHSVERRLPEEKQKKIRHLYDPGSALTGRKVLIIDDDVRNIFALTSLLEGHGIQVFYAERGKEGLEILDANPDVDLVLLDIMMPEMDGYEITRLIRRDSRRQHLPVVALTAKAMKGDREKCIDAGASDYISKPVDASRLLSLLQVWLYRGE
jgi:CheY-like chemotaxis protein/HAMP domain-containing protein